MARKRLFLPCAENSIKSDRYKDHGANVRENLSAASMRAIGRAFDEGVIIKEEASEAPVR